MNSVVGKELEKYLKDSQAFLTSFATDWTPSFGFIGDPLHAFCSTVTLFGTR